MHTPHLSLIVLSFRRFEQTTGPCIESLQGQPLDDRIELILVDNGSDDGSADACAALAESDGRIRYMGLPDNLGFGGGMNAGAAVAQGSWLLLVNSDTLFPSACLDALLRVLALQPPAVGLVGPVTNAAGTGQCLPLPSATLEQARDAGSAAMREPTNLLMPLYRTDFFCAAVRRSVWIELNGLDPVFGMGYYEDFDFSLRLRALGYQQVMAEDVFIVHAGSAVFSTMRAEQKALLKRNRALLLSRHPNAKFEHLRIGNAAALHALVDTAGRQGWTPALQQRAAWRYAALLHNEPRSPFKRWLWRRRQRPLRQALNHAGIVPAFPALPHTTST